MKIAIECTPLQLESISKALQMVDYSIVSHRNIPKEGWALARICLEYIESKELKRNKE